MKPKILVCGLGRTGYRIFTLLKQQGAQVVGISAHPMPDAEGEIVVGDLRKPRTLLQAGINDAHTLLLANSDDALNLAILTQARLLNPHIRIINRLFNTSLGERLDYTLPHHVSMSVAALAAPLFAFAALGNRAIGQITLFDQIWPIHEEHIDEFHPWKGMPLKELWENRSRMLIYYLPAQQSVDLITAVLHNQTLQPGDRLIVANKPNSQRNRRALGQKIQVFWGTLAQFRRQGRAALLLTLALLVTIALATTTYMSANLETSLVDALYFSVGMITGAGGMEGVAESSAASIKLFTAVMMLVGAGVIGVCYALLNDFVLGTHLQQIWNAARLPQHHHYVVCGLGGVGYQIVSQLQASGYEVVAIERDPNGRFINAVRSLNVPVIIADASVPSTLQMVNIQRAAAVLAVTSDDTVNLEIALTAKGLAPKVQVVVRNQDPKFALQIQQVFEFDRVMSPVELAAPAFAAAAIGGRIFGNGTTADSLWVAIATLITPGHPFCGKPITQVASAADLVPLYVEAKQVEAKQRKVHGWNLMNHTLQNGDVLYLTIPANRLEQLWRAVPQPIQAN